MQIEVTQEKSVTFKLSDDGNDDACTTFAKIMHKCTEEAKKKGFRNMFTSDERSFLREFSEKIIFSQNEA